MVAKERKGNRISQGFAPIQITQLPTLEQHYLKDKEQFFHNSTIKITPFSEIHKLTQTIKHKLTPIVLLDLAHFDQAMREIHEEDKGKQA